MHRTTALRLCTVYLSLNIGLKTQFLTMLWKVTYFIKSMVIPFFTTTKHYNQATIYAKKMFLWNITIFSLTFIQPQDVAIKQKLRDIKRHTRQWESLCKLLRISSIHIIKKLFVESLCISNWFGLTKKRKGIT